MRKYARRDTKRPDGFYVKFGKVVVPDTDASPMDYLFQDPEYREQDQARLDAFNAGQWGFVGVMARANCLIVRNGTETHYAIDSAGLWGIESDSEESYFDDVFEEEVGDLLSAIEAMKNPQILESV